MTTRRRAAMAMAMAVAVGAAARAAAAEPAPPPELAPRLAKLDAYFAQQVAAHHFPGLVASVTTRDGVVWTHAYGERDRATHAKMTPDQRFRIGSITKVVTALAVLKLRDEGKLSLDAPASTYLPELATVTPPTRDSPPITLRHLMTHTSGMPREAPMADSYGTKHEVTEAEVLAAVRATKLETATGTASSYSNFGVGLEGIIVSRVAKRPYFDYVRDEILRPLGITTAAFDRSQIPAGLRAESYDADGKSPSVALHEGATGARGMLYMTVPDLAAIATAELRAWPPRDDADAGPVRRSTLRESQRTEGPSPPGTTTHGAAWFLEKTPHGLVVDHGGAGDGYMSDLWFQASAGVGLAVMINDEDGSLAEVARGTREILLGAPVDALAALLALANDPTPAHAARVVSPRYLVGLQERHVLDALTAIHAHLGPCVLATTDATAARPTGTATCGTVVFRIAATLDDDGLIDALLFAKAP